MTSNNPVISTVIKEYKYTQNAFLPKFVTIPLCQEVDVEYKSVVQEGDVVTEGQVIAESTNLEEKSYIHSSIPGTVEGIIPCYLPNAKQCYGVKIKFGGSLSYLGKRIEDEKLEYLTPYSIKEFIGKNAVVNTFNITYPKNFSNELNSIKEKSNVVVRLFDEDPYRATDSLIAKFYIDEIVKGAAVLAKLINATSVIFAIDQKLQTKEVYKDIELPNFTVLEMNIKKYPCGTAREIMSAFRRSNAKKNLSFKLNKNDLYIDASTCYEVYKAVTLKTPSITRPVQFTGNCLQASCLLDVKIGTPIKEIITQIGGLVKNPAIVIVNGDYCGYSMQSLEAPITKYVKSVKVLSNRKTTDNQLYECINCGNCRVACPVNISPDILYNTKVSLNNLSQSFAKSSLSCISCGLCNTVCPARLPLSQTISVLKDKVNEYMKEQNEKLD